METRFAMSPGGPQLTFYLGPLAYSHQARSECLAGQAKCVSFASCFKQRTNSPFGHFSLQREFSCIFKAFQPSTT